MSLLTNLLGASIVVFLLGGSKVAKETAKTNSLCLRLKLTEGVENSLNDNYANCMWNLEQLVNKVIESRQINFSKCKMDKKLNNLAWCPLWVWWHRTQVMVTNPDWVEGIAAKKDLATIEANRNRNPDPEARKIVLKNLANENEDEGRPVLTRRNKVKLANPEGFVRSLSSGDRTPVGRGVASDDFLE